jgi:hypothetical protein
MNLLARLFGGEKLQPIQSRGYRKTDDLGSALSEAEMHYNNAMEHRDKTHFSNCELGEANYQTLIAIGKSVSVDDNNEVYEGLLKAEKSYAKAQNTDNGAEAEFWYGKACYLLSRAIAEHLKK